MPERASIVLPIKATIERIIERRLSVSRFGDGEMDIIAETRHGKGTRFQPHNAGLALRLKETLASDDIGHMVCIPDMFGITDGPGSRKLLVNQFYKMYRGIFRECLIHGKEYGNPYITRLYDFYGKKAAPYFELVKGIWQGRRVLIVEGSKSRLGMGNDLFDNAAGIRRILCPPVDAFAVYDVILNETSRLARKGELILLALGQTATVLALDLHRRGFQAIDIGHIDIQYEHFLAGGVRAVPNKFTNEVSDGSNVGEEKDPTYLSQIVENIAHNGKRFALKKEKLREYKQIKQMKEGLTNAARPALRDHHHSQSNGVSPAMRGKRIETNL